MRLQLIRKAENICRTMKGITAVLAVFVSVVLYGCVLARGDAQEAGSASRDRTQTLYFWYSDDALSNFINSAAVAFGEREGIYVIPVLVEEQEYLEAINHASLYSAQMPDDYIISHDSLEKAYLAGLAAPIQDEGGICDEEHFPQAALSAVSYQGRLVGYPLSFETCALVYNAAYLAQWSGQAAGEEGSDAAAGGIPSTMEDILAIANTFDTPQGVESILRWDVSDILYNYWIVGGCVDVGGEWGDDPQKVDINNPEALACLETYKGLSQIFPMEPDEVGYDAVITDFCEGKLMFAIASTDVVKTLADAKESGELGFEYGIALLPQVREGLPSRSLSVTHAVAVNGYSEHPESANRFAAYLADECGGSLYAKTGKPSASKAADAGNGPLLVFKEEYARSVPLPKMMAAGDFWLQMEGLFSKLWDGGDESRLLQELEEQIKTQTQRAYIF